MRIFFPVSSGMERKGVAICSLVGFFALLSAAAGFAAEATRIKGSQVQFVSVNQCSYPRSPAMALGLTAAVALMVAHLIINVSTGCICCKRSSYPSNPNWRFAVIFFVLSWFTFAIAFVLLLTGASLNDEHGEESMYLGNYYCYVVKPGVFSGGAVLSLASLMLGMAYYLMVRMAKNNLNVWGNPPPPAHGVVALAQAQGSQEPVFVPHDTYMRREFP